MMNRMKQILFVKDDLEDGDDFSEDEEDDMPSSSDGEEERIIRQVNLTKT